MNVDASRCRCRCDLCPWARDGGHYSDSDVPRQYGFFVDSYNSSSGVVYLIEGRRQKRKKKSLGVLLVS